MTPEFVCRKLQIRSETAQLVDLQFSIRTSMALVGQSGSGKSLTLKALLDMLPSNLQAEKSITADFLPKRGETIGYVPQNPFTALSPLTKIKRQWFEEKAHQAQMLKKVGLSGDLLERFPPQLSGGQLQRIVLAMALSAKVKLLLLDEPTTALDAPLRRAMIELLKQMQAEMGFLMLFVTHDIQSARELCTQITVIKEGKVVEQGAMHETVAEPKSAYTKALIEANFANREFRR